MMVYDAREPLFANDIVLALSNGQINLWHGGMSQVTLNATQLDELGKGMQDNQTPNWYDKEYQSAKWPLPAVGKVLCTLAERMAANEGNPRPALTHLYGGNLFGPANPDMQKAYLVIDDAHTVSWVAR